MKITKAVVKQFESDQKQFGTRTAIYSLLWSVTAELFRDIGITTIKTGRSHIFRDVKNWR